MLPAQINQQQQLSHMSQACAREGFKPVKGRRELFKCAQFSSPSTTQHNISAMLMKALSPAQKAAWVAVGTAPAP